MRRRPSASVRPRRDHARRPSAEAVEPRVLLATYIVNTPLDTFTSDLLSLREALIIANDTPGPHRIEFNIPGGGVQRIVLGSPLPHVANEIVIDGTTQPGYVGRPLIEIDGSQINPVEYPFASGLVIAQDPFGQGYPVDGSQVIALSIFGFEGSGIEAFDAHAIALVANYLGVDATGQTAPGNGDSGAYLIGLDASVAAANVVGGQPIGIQVLGGSGVSLFANRVGTTADGLAPLPNRFGVVASGIQGFNLGTVQHGGNLISGNTTGVQLVGVDSVLAVANRIGTTADGLAPLPNSGDGLLLLNTSNVVVGLPGAGNLISGNGISGVHIAQADFRSFGSEGGVTTQAITNPRAILLSNRIGTNAGGNLALPNGNAGVFVDGVGGVQIGLPGAGNLISGNTYSNIQVFSPLATGNVIQGNRIGTTADGMAIPGASPVGIFVNNAPGNLIGGAADNLGNVIAGQQTGILLYGPGARSNTVQANRVGTNLAATAALGNGTGVLILDAPANLIGGNGPAGNVVSGSGPFGVRIVGPTATGNVLLGNRIGTNLDGTIALGNLGDGVFLQSPGNVVASNQIAASAQSGIQVFGAAASGNQIVANRIGATADGLAPLGNALDGIFINEAPNTLIAGNQIVANGLAGLQLAGTGTTGTIVRDNLIGAAPDGLPSPGLGNAYGLFDQSGSRNNTIDRSNIIVGSTEFNVIVGAPPVTITPVRQTARRPVTASLAKTADRRASWAARLLP